MAIRISERIRRAIEDASILHPAMNLGEVVTVSIGIASSSLSREIQVSLIVSAADTALYSAKRNGRNQVALIFRLRKSSTSLGRRCARADAVHNGIRTSAKSLARHAAAVC
jgi:predicted signal transduction protein with EAL and GGDEF domain